MTKLFFITIFLVMGINTCCFASNNALANEMNVQSVSKNVNPVDGLYGYWKIADYRWAGISSDEEKNPKRLVGKVALFFGSDHAQILGVSAIFCKAPEYKFHYEKNAADYLLDNYRSAPVEIGINTKDLNVIEVNCAGANNVSGTGPSADVFIINKNQIIYKKDGPYYFLEKVKN